MEPTKERTIDSSTNPKYKELVNRKDRMLKIIAEKTPAMRTSKMEEWALVCMDEFAQQELQAYRDIIKELLPLAENEIKMSTCIGYSYDKWKSTISKARKLIDTVTPT